LNGHIPFARFEGEERVVDCRLEVPVVNRAVFRKAHLIGGGDYQFARQRFPGTGDPQPPVNALLPERQVITALALDR
jgi:hypothetical protein